jgi:hypothetical protein
MYSAARIFEVFGKRTYLLNFPGNIDHIFINYFAKSRMLQGTSIQFFNLSSVYTTYLKGSWSEASTHSWVDTYGDWGKESGFCCIYWERIWV